MSPKQQLLTATEVAVELDVSASTVRRWADDGKLPSVPLPSGRRRYRRADVDQILAGDPRDSSKS